jgi:hypothetical protein
MLLVDLLVALAVALLLTAIFTAGTRSRGIWVTWLLFFAMVLLAAWAGGMWLRPIGPPVRGVYWLPFLVVGLVVALLLAATMPRAPVLHGRAPGPERGPEVEMTFSIFFWVLMVGLAIAILLAYV